MRPDPLVLDLLRCPACAGALALSAGDMAADGHVMTGSLRCESCATSYAIQRGVPRLVARALTQQVEATVDAFGWQWQQANRLIKDPRFSAPDVFLDFIHPVTREWFEGKIVLDAGCGLGRFTSSAARFGARLVVGVDLSDAVDSAFDNTRQLDNVAIVQGDILRLPLAPRIDYAFSVGVLHHTSDPRGAFLHIVSKLVPGGSISAWVYGRENNGWIVYGVNPVRKVTSRLPRPLLLAAAYAAAVPLALVAKGIYRPVSRHASLGSLRPALFYFDYLVFLSQFDLRTLAFVIFDHAVPTIAEYIRREEFAEWFAAARLDEVAITMRGGNSWRGFGTGAP